MLKLVLINKLPYRAGSWCMKGVWRSTINFGLWRAKNSTTPVRTMHLCSLLLVVDDHRYAISSQVIPLRVGPLC